jgi:HSP20 family protein
MEREEGSFSRTITLPASVDRNAVEAKTKNGVLTITLPKKGEEQKPKITIKEE